MRSPRVLATLPADPAPVTRVTVESQLEQFEEALTLADRKGLWALAGQVQDLALKLFWWRQLLAEAGRAGGSGWPTPPPERDERYHATVQRAFQLRSELAARWQAPLEPEHDQRPARAVAAAALDAAVAWLEGSLLASEGDGALAQGADGWWNADGEVAAAYERLDRLVESTKAQLTRPAPPWDAVPNDAGWRPSQRFAPGGHLTPADGTRPALGTEIVADVSEQMRKSMVDAAIELLPAAIQRDPETRRGMEEALAGNAILADDGGDLVMDGILVEVKGYAVRLGVWLTDWAQTSDVFEARPKAMRNMRRRLGRDVSHSYFADANLNLSWALDLNGPDTKIPVADSTYAGILTALLGEHEESFGDVAVNQTEHTVKGSSYRSLSFGFAARPWVQVRYPDGAVRTTGNALAEVPQAILMVASREAAVQLSGRDPRSVMHANPHVDYRNVAGDWTRPPIPFNSTVEAIPSASMIRERAEQYVFGAGSLPDAGSLRYRKLAAALRPGMLRSGLHEALLDRHGYRVDFGDIDGRGAASLGVHIELGDPTPVTLWDPLTWSDTSRLRRTALGHEQVSADAIDIPPGLLLAATSMVFSWGSAEPYLFAWPTLDTLVTRAGVGVDVTESSGLRMTGIPQSVLRFPATVRFSRSDQPHAPSPTFDLPGGVLVRMPIDDARRWVELPPLPGDIPADQVPRLRLPKTNFLPPVMQISDVAFVPEPAAASRAAEDAPTEPARAVDLVEHVLALLRQHFPGTVPHEDGSATRFGGDLTRSLADARQATENLETVTRHLRTASLPGLAMQMATADGFSFRLARKDISARLGDDVVVRVHAPLVREGSGGGQLEVWHSDGRWVPQAEMDAFVTTSEDLTHASVRTAGLWLGIEPLVSLSHPTLGPLEGIEPRPLIRGRVVRTSTNVSGFDVSGLRGVSLDEAAQFQANVAFRVTVESAPPLRRVDLQGIRDDDQVVMPATFVEAAPVTDEERGTEFPRGAAEATPALPRVINGPWLPARYTMLVPAELTEQQLEDGAWVSRTVARLIESGQLPPATRRLTGAGGRPLEFRPSPAKPLPRRVLVMTGADGLPKAAIEALNELRSITLTPAQRVELDSALAAKTRQAHSLLGDAREVWSGRVGMFHTATVKLRYVPAQLETRGVAEGYGTFTDFGIASIAGLGTERQRGAFLGMRLRFPFDAGGTADVPAEDDRVAQNLVSYQPQAAVRRDTATGTETEHSGVSSRLTLQIGRTVLADIRGHFEVTAEVKHRLTGARQVTRQARHIDAEGLAAMPELTGTQLGLMPEGMEVELDKTVTYVIPEQVRYSQGLGGWIEEAPDISPFIHEVVASVRSRFGQSLAGPLDEELDKLTDPDVTASTLDLFFGGFRQTVAASRYQRLSLPLLEATVPVIPGQATVTVTINAEYAGDEYRGVSSTQYYLGQWDAVERVERRRDVRQRRLAVDPVRGWLRRFPNRGVLNSEWYQFNLTGFGQTNRETSVGTGRERGHGLTLDTGAQGRGAAMFDVFLNLSATVTVATTPAGMLDAASLGAAQTTTTWTIPRHTLREPVTVMYDPHLMETTLNPSPPDPYVGRPALDTADRQPAVADRPVPEIITRPVQWGPITRSDNQRPLSDVVRRGIAIDPVLLEDAVVTNMPDLDLIREQVYRFGGHPTVDPDGSLFDWIWSQWRNRVLSPSANASWFNSQALHDDFVYAIINRPFLTPRIRPLLTSGITQPLRLPGRLYQTQADLELVADVVSISKGRSTDDGQNRRTHQDTSAITASTDVVAGYSMSPWANWDWPVHGYRHFRPDRNNAVGGLLGVDYIQTDGDRASLRSRTGSGQQYKTTGRSFTELHLMVRWSAGISTPGEASRIYSTDETLRQITLLVPNEVVQLILSGVDAPPAGYPAHDGPVTPGGYPAQPNPEPADAPPPINVVEVDTDAAVPGDQVELRAAGKGKQRDGGLPRGAAGRSGDGERLEKSWTDDRKLWMGVLDELAGYAAAPELGGELGAPEDRGEAFSIYARARMDDETARAALADAMTAAPDGAAGSSSGRGTAAASARLDAQAKAARDRLDVARRWLALWGIANAEAAWHASEVFAAAKAANRTSGLAGGASRGSAGPGAGSSVPQTSTDGSPMAAAPAAPPVNTVRVAGGALITTRDSNDPYLAGMRFWMDPGRSYTIVLDHVADHQPAAEMLEQVAVHLASVPDDLRVLVVTSIAMPGTTEGQAAVRHSLARISGHPQVAAILRITARDSRLATTAPRPGSVLSGLVESGVASPPLVVDAPTDQPIVVDAMARIVSAQNAVEGPLPIEPVVLVWDGAQVPGPNGAAAPAQRLADQWRMPVEVHGANVVRFWPGRVALSADHRWPIPPWTAFLNPDRLSQAAPGGFTLTRIPAGVLLQHGAAPVPPDVQLVRPSRSAAVVVAAGPDLSVDDAAQAIRHVVTALFQGWPVPLTLLVTGDADPVEVAERAVERLAPGTVIRVSPQSTWTITPDGVLDGRPHIATNDEPQPLWRVPGSPLWFTSPDHVDEPLDAASLRWAHQFLAVPGMAGIVVLPSRRMEAVIDEISVEDSIRAEDQVDAWIDQLAREGMGDRPLVLLLAGMDEDRSRYVAQFVQQRIDRRLRDSQPAPPGLVASLGFPPAGWFWRSPLQGNTAHVADGAAARTHATFDELDAAVAHMMTRLQAPFAVSRAVSDWLTANRNEWELPPEVLARRAAEAIPLQPSYLEQSAPIAGDEPGTVGMDEVLVPVPADVTASMAEQILAVREWLRLGMVRAWPDEDHATVAVRLAYPHADDEQETDDFPGWRSFRELLTAALRNGMWLPATATRPAIRAVPLPPAQVDDQDEIDGDDPPTGTEMDLWVNHYRSGYAADLVDREIRNRLEESIPRHAAHRVVVEFGRLNPHPVDGYSAGSLLWSRPDSLSGQWVTAEQYIADLPDAGERRPIVVLLGVTRHQSAFVQALTAHSVVVIPGPGRVYDPRPGRDANWHSPSVWRVNGAWRQGTLATVLRSVAGRIDGDWYGPTEAAIDVLLEASGSFEIPSSAIVAAVRRWYEDQPMWFLDVQPANIWLPIPEREADPISYLQRWLTEHELVGLHAGGARENRLRLIVPDGYLRYYAHGDDVDAAVIDTQALARSRATVTLSADGETVEISPGPAEPPPAYRSSSDPIRRRPVLGPDPTVDGREHALMAELGLAGARSLLTEAGQILHGHARAGEIAVTGSLRQPVLQVAESLLWFGYSRAEVVAARLRAVLNIVDPEPSDRDVSVNRTEQAQDRVLDRLDRTARWTPPDGDCVLASIIAAAREAAGEDWSLARLAEMTPTSLRLHLVEILGSSPDLVDLLRRVAAVEIFAQQEYLEFRNALETPGQWAHPLFDALVETLPDMLNVRMVIVEPDGRLTERGSPDRPPLYLVRTGNHYRPAQRSPRVREVPLPGGLLVARPEHVDALSDEYRRWLDPGNRYTIMVGEPMDGPFAAVHLRWTLARLDSVPAFGSPVIVAVYGNVPGGAASVQALEGPDAAPVNDAARVRYLLDWLIDDPRVAAVVWLGEVGPGFPVVRTLAPGEPAPSAWASSVAEELVTAGVAPGEAVLVQAGSPDAELAEVVAGIAMTSQTAMAEGPQPNPSVLVWDRAAALPDGTASVAQRWANRWGVAVHAPIEYVVVDDAGLRGVWYRFEPGVPPIALGEVLPRRDREAPPALVRALTALPPWQGEADCVARVMQVLRRLGSSGAVANDDGAGSRDVDGLVRWLGGGRFQSGRLDLLAQLAPGEVTVMWVEAPNDPRHVVLVWRDSDGRLWQIETQAPRPGQFLPFDPAQPVSPGGYPTATARVVTDDDGRLGRMVAGGAVAPARDHTPEPAGQHSRWGSGRSATTIDALLDPPTTNAPGMSRKRPQSPEDQARRQRPREDASQPAASMAEVAGWRPRPDGEGPRTLRQPLSEAEQVDAWLQSRDLTRVNVSGDGNCTYHGLIAVAGPYLAERFGVQRLAPMDLRGYLAHILRQDQALERAGQPTRYGGLIHEDPDRPVATRDDLWNQYIRWISTDGAWTNDAADLVLPLLAFEFGLPLTVVQPGRVTDIGPDGPHRFVLVLHGGHYWATRPRDGRLQPRPNTTDVSAQVARLQDQFAWLQDRYRQLSAGRSDPDGVGNRAARYAAEFATILGQQLPWRSRQPYPAFTQQQLERLRHSHREWLSAVRNIVPQIAPSEDAAQLTIDQLRDHQQAYSAQAARPSTRPAVPRPDRDAQQQPHRGDRTAAPQPSGEVPGRRPDLEGTSPHMPQQSLRSRLRSRPAGPAGSAMTVPPASLEPRPGLSVNAGHEPSRPLVEPRRRGHMLTPSRFNYFVGVQGARYMQFVRDRTHYVAEHLNLLVPEPERFAWLSYPGSRQNRSYFTQLLLAKVARAKVVDNQGQVPRLIEPFVGPGQIFLNASHWGSAIDPGVPLFSAVIGGDLNHYLVGVYRGLQAGGFWRRYRALAREWDADVEGNYAQRLEELNHAPNPMARDALYRYVWLVNRSGRGTKLNPDGRLSATLNRTAPGRANRIRGREVTALRNVRRLLQQINFDVEVRDFVATSRLATRQDIVVLDPTFSTFSTMIPTSDEAHPEQFGSEAVDRYGISRENSLELQTRVVDEARRLVRQGTTVILHNNANPGLVEAYAGLILDTLDPAQRRHYIYTYRSPLSQGEAFQLVILPGSGNAAVAQSPNEILNSWMSVGGDDYRAGEFFGQNQQLQRQFDELDMSRRSIDSDYDDDSSQHDDEDFDDGDFNDDIDGADADEVDTDEYIDTDDDEDITMLIPDVAYIHDSDDSDDSDEIDELAETGHRSGASAVPAAWLRRPGFDADAVAEWQPPEPGARGARTLRELLQSMTPEGVVPAVGGMKKLQEWLRPYVKAWVVRQSWDPGSRSTPLRTQGEVAELTGGLLAVATISLWWNEVVVPAPPADVVGWRPRRGGPPTLRQYLESRELPAGVSLARTAQRRLGRGMSEWVQAWVVDVFREHPDWDSQDVADMSGGLVGINAVSAWWRRHRAAGRL